MISDDEKHHVCVRITGKIMIFLCGKSPLVPTQQMCSLT